MVLTWVSPTRIQTLDEPVAGEFVRAGGRVLVRVRAYVRAHPAHALHTKDSMSNGMQRMEVMADVGALCVEA